MSAQDQLLNRYQQWQHWSQAEQDAIVAADWTALERCQTHKAFLQSEIIPLTAEANGCPKTEEFVQRQHQLRVRLQELIQFEMRTAELLIEARARAERQSRELTRARVNLKRVHRSYGRPRNSAWSSYS